MILSCFFLHLGLLVLQDAAVPEGYLESFAALSFAIRLLSESSVLTNQIQQAEFLIGKFFDNFLTLYDSDSQSFNVHTMRHLVEQVKRNGPLWQFSAFGFESANHNLLSAVSGTIKNPQNIAERFLRHQSAFESHFYKTSTSNKNYLTTLLLYQIILLASVPCIILNFTLVDLLTIGELVLDRCLTQEAV